MPSGASIRPLVVQSQAMPFCPILQRFRAAARGRIPAACVDPARRGRRGAPLRGRKHPRGAFAGRPCAVVAAVGPHRGNIPLRRHMLTTQSRAGARQLREAHRTPSGYTPPHALGHPSTRVQSVPRACAGPPPKRKVRRWTTSAMSTRASPL